MTIKNITRITLLFFVLAFSGVSCKKDSDEDIGSPGTNEVWMRNTAFTPQTISVALNTTITWTNKESMTHTVTSDNGSFNSGNLSNGGTFAHKFTVAGTFSYHCNFHSGMTGSVVVQ